MVFIKNQRRTGNREKKLWQCLQTAWGSCRRSLASGKASGLKDHLDTVSMWKNSRQKCLGVSAEIKNRKGLQVGRPESGCSEESRECIKETMVGWREWLIRACEGLISCVQTGKLKTDGVEDPLFWVCFMLVNKTPGRVVMGHKALYSHWGCWVKGKLRQDPAEPLQAVKRCPREDWLLQEPFGWKVLKYKILFLKWKKIMKWE